MPVTLQPTTLKYKDGQTFVSADCLKGDPGSPGDPTQLIDDTAGGGDTDKTWSADKLSSTADSKADVANPNFTGSISMGRVANTTVGEKSTATGNLVTASGPNSNAEGYGTTASGNSTHAEGNQTFAVGDYSHSQGYGTRANGYASSAEGNGTVANGANSSVSGMYNVPDSYVNWPDWAPNTYYAAGAKVHFQDEESGDPRGEYFVCNTPHTSGTAWITYSFYWDSDNGKMNYAQIVGNGSNYLQQSNAYTLDWNGNGSYAGDVTINKGTANEVSVSELKTEIAKGQPTATDSDIGKFIKLKSIDQNGKPTEFEYGAGGGGTVDSALSTSSTNPVQNKAITGVINSIAENGYYPVGSSDVYIPLESGMLGKNGTATVDQLISAAGDTGYIFIQKANVPDEFYFDDTKYKANLVFIKNNYEIASTYTSWDTTSPLQYTEPAEEWDTIGINVRKLSGNFASGERSTALYKKVSGTFGNLATKDYVDNHKREGHKCIYPDGFTSRIKPDIFYDGKYYVNVNPSDYMISGTGEVWVATNGNDTTGDGTEGNPYATITKALTVSAVTIHIKEGTYTQGTHYGENCYLGGKNVIGHGTVVFQNDSSGHYASASSSAYIENITFKHGHATSNPAFYASCTANGKCVCFVNCVFRDGGTNGLGVEGTDAVLFKCVSYGNRYDGFNYHARTLNNVTYIPNVLEVDCKAYNNGTDQSGSDSCNGSTSHDGAKVIRLNGEYYSCYGGVIADIATAGDETTITVNYGILAHDSTGTGTYNASFWASHNTKMYLYDCLCYGSTYDITALNDAIIVSRRLTTGRDVPSVNTGASATVYQY